MTKRLYHADAYSTTFDAQIVDKQVINGQPAVILNQTLFYPAAGGQPFDTGYLDDSRVIEVLADKKNGLVQHILDNELTAASVQGKLDWDRRFEHMQHHSGQHLLSQTFYHLFGFETVSMRIGQVDTTLDLDTEAMDQTQLDQAERYANDIIYENRVIQTYTVSDQEVGRLPLRRKPAVTGQIRIVEITGFDYSACGGTHCSSTGEIGLIKLLKTERRRGVIRVTFKCGRRALGDYATKHRLITTIAERLSTHEAEVPEVVERQTKHLKQLQKNYERLEKAQLNYESQEILAAGERVRDLTLIVKIFSDRELAQVKALATVLQQNDQTIILLASTAGQKLGLVYARSADVALDMGQILRTSLIKFAGRGGGSADFAQGGGPAPAAAPDILADSKQQVCVQLRQ